MKSYALLAASLTIGGCMTRPVVTVEIPHCDRYIPPSLKEPVESADFPATRAHPDGHADAQPWREFGIEQTGQLDKSNDRSAAKDHIWKTCLDEHRAQYRSSTKGWLGRLFD